MGEKMTSLDSHPELPPQNPQALSSPPRPCERQKLLPRAAVTDIPWSQSIQIAPQG